MLVLRSAIFESSGWSGDLVGSVVASSPWYVRGGQSGSGGGSGISSLYFDSVGVVGFCGSNVI
ncbi:hypothetical protein FWH09_02205 [Candidatus Saccharibacteria bacterium]|nr:hypothetical protein [Candidatus Saccharibacteria bacterium]